MNKGKSMVMVASMNTLKNNLTLTLDKSIIIRYHIGEGGR